MTLSSNCGWATVPGLCPGFDRANLTYRVQARQRAWESLVDLLDERRNESAIVYCFSRK